MIRDAVANAMEEGSCLRTMSALVAELDKALARAPALPLYMAIQMKEPAEPFDGFEVPQIPGSAEEAEELELAALRRRVAAADTLALVVEAEGATMGLAKALAAYRSA